jgi:hypothetical protein
MATGFWRSGVTFAVAALIALGGVTAAPGAATNATGGFVMSPVGSADPASGAAAANRGATVYATHSVLISATTAFTTKRIEQQGYNAPGDGGWAEYDWNSSSYCPGGTFRSPAAADGLFCVLPSNQIATTPGRFLLRIPGGGIHPEAAGAFCNTPTTGVAATGPWSALQPTISVPSGEPWSAGQIVYDTTITRRIGVISSYVGTTLTLSGSGAAYASQGSVDTLVIGDDDAAAFQNLANYVSHNNTGLGTIIFSTKQTNQTCLIDSADLVVPTGVKLQGVGGFPTDIIGVNSIGDLPAIQLNPAYTIKPQTGAVLENMLIWRAGLAAQPASVEALYNYQFVTLCDGSGWNASTGRCAAPASVAISVIDGVGGSSGRDVRIQHVATVGFNEGIYGYASTKLKVDDFLADGASGFEITQTGDVATFTNIRSQEPYSSKFGPFVSVYAATVPPGGGGTRYQVGDLLTVPPGAGACATNPILRVASVDAKGAVTAYEADNQNGSDTGACRLANTAETFGISPATLPVVYASGSGGPVNRRDIPLTVISKSSTTTASQPWTGSTKILVNSCPGATANVSPIFDETTDTLIGTYVSCTGSSSPRTLTVSALSSGAAGDVLAFGKCDRFPVLLGSTDARGTLSAIIGVQDPGACVGQSLPDVHSAVIGGGLSGAQVNGVPTINRNGITVPQDYYVKNPVSLTGGSAGSSGAQAILSIVMATYRPGIGAYVHDQCDGCYFSHLEFEGNQTDIQVSNIGFGKFRAIGGEGYTTSWNIPTVGLDLENCFNSVSFMQTQFGGVSTGYLLNNAAGPGCIGGGGSSPGVSIIEMGLAGGVVSQTNAPGYQGVVAGPGSSGVIVAPHLNAGGGIGSPPLVQIGSGAGQWTIDDIVNTSIEVGANLRPINAWLRVAPSAAPPLSPQLAWNATGSLLINGDFGVNQIYENNVSEANPTYYADRWRGHSISAQSVTGQRMTSATPPGYAYNLVLTNKARATPDSGQYASIYQNVEGQPAFATLRWGTANAESVEVEWQAKASVAGTYDLDFWASNLRTSYVHPFTIKTANDWQSFSTVVPGATTGSWSATPGGMFLTVGFDLGAYCPSASAGVCSGSGGLVAPEVDAWESGQYNESAGATQFIAQAPGATIAFAGVHLRPGPFAAPYQPRDPGDEMMLAKRFYQKSYPAGTPVGQNQGATGAAVGSLVSKSAASTIYVPFGVTMFGNPTISFSNPSASNRNCRDLTAGADLGLATVAAPAGSNGFTIECPLAGAPSVGNLFGVHWAADASH